MLACIHVCGLFDPGVIQDLVGSSIIQENVRLSSYGKILMAQTALEAAGAQGANCQLRTAVWWWGSFSVTEETHASNNQEKF